MDEVIEKKEEAPIEEKPREYTEEEKAELAKNQEAFDLLAKNIESMIDEIYKLPIPVGIIETDAVELFRNYQRMKTSRSRQWDTFTKEQRAAQDKFFTLNASELVDMPYEESVAQDKK